MNIDSTADAAESAFATLDPNRLLDAVDQAGYSTDGRISALNSYENRVYSIGLEDGSSRVVKFYRPGRWSDSTLREEHSFTAELVACDLPVIHAEGPAEQLLREHDHFRFAVYPLAGGRPPELDNPDQLETIGRTIARLHTVGELSPFQSRPTISLQQDASAAVESVLESGHVPAENHAAYRSIALELVDVVKQQVDAVENGLTMIRVHGDFHTGNILWGSDETPHLLDFDDCLNGFAVQDLWMFLSGDSPYRQARLGDLLAGYSEFREFDARELALIEPLRAVRQLGFAAWLSKRWQEPTFVRAFPYFGDARFWDSHILALKEQRTALDEQLLRWD